MSTAQERYAAATARVRSTIEEVSRQRIGYAVDDKGAARWYAGREEAAKLRATLAPIEARWLRASSVEDRERAALDAEQFADQIAPRAPAHGCERDAGLIDIQTPGSVKAEMNTVSMPKPRKSNGLDEGFSSWLMNSHTPRRAMIPTGRLM